MIKDYVDIPEKNLKKLEQAIMDALKQLENGQIKSSYPYFYNELKKMLETDLGLVRDKKDKELVFKNGHYMGQVAAFDPDVSNVDPNYSRKLLAVSWEVRECFDPNNPSHIDTKKRIEMREKKKAAFIKVLDEIDKQLLEKYVPQLAFVELQKKVHADRMELHDIKEKILDGAIYIHSFVSTKPKEKFVLPDKIRQWCDDKEVLALVDELERKFYRL